jgi:hypothetical protein
MLATKSLSRSSIFGSGCNGQIAVQCQNLSLFLSLSFSRHLEEIMHSVQDQFQIQGGLVRLGQFLGQLEQAFDAQVHEP